MPTEHSIQSAINAAFANLPHSAVSNALIHRPAMEDAFPALENLDEKTYCVLYQEYQHKVDTPFGLYMAHKMGRFMIFVFLAGLFFLYWAEGAFYMGFIIAALCSFAIHILAGKWIEYRTNKANQDFASQARTFVPSKNQPDAPHQPSNISTPFDVPPQE